jgi:hypothetical protein
MPRRDQPTEFLDPTVAKIRAALLARAGEIGSHMDIVRKQSRVHGFGPGAIPEPMVQMLADAIGEIVATEFRLLAEELHHW